MPVVNGSGTLLGYLKYRDPIRAAQVRVRVRVRVSRRAVASVAPVTDCSHGHSKYSHTQ
tara:strand:+ start:111 stop:287 length:177 start_codon:yes stop_codon:yes gene_type:complete